MPVPRLRDSPGAGCARGHGRRLSPSRARDRFRFRRCCSSCRVEPDAHPLASSLVAVRSSEGISRTRAGSTIDRPSDPARLRPRPAGDLDNQQLSWSASCDAPGCTLPCLAERCDAFWQSLMTSADGPAAPSVTAGAKRPRRRDGIYLSWIILHTVAGGDSFALRKSGTIAPSGASQPENRLDPCAGAPGPGRIGRATAGRHPAP